MGTPKWLRPRYFSFLSRPRVSAYRGANAEGGALGAFLQAVKHNQVPAGWALVIESLDRLSRQEIGEALNLFLSILRNDIEIITLEPEQRFTRKSINDIPNILTAIIFMARANEESKTKSERIKAAFNKQLAEKSPLRVPNTPRWLTIKNGKFEVVPEHVNIIKQLYDWRSNGLGYSKILVRLGKWV